MSYHQLTQYQRHELGALVFGRKHSLREIAALLSVHHSTVSRELRRHAWHNLSGYDARQARLALKAKRLAANQHHRKLSRNPQLVALVTAKLVAHYSPEQIAGWLRATRRAVRVCAQTIYDWLYQHARHLLCRLHCRKGKYRRTREHTLRKAFRDDQRAARSIDVRPAHILARRTYGHWEGDTVVGTARSGSIATFVERKSGYLIARLLPDKGAKSFEQAARQCFAGIAPQYRRTLTLDNGAEMSNYEEIERATDLRVYFAHPYHSWERGTNENTNGLLRFYFPKQMSFAHLTQTELDRAVQEMNTRPRKRLGYRTPAQVLRATGAIRGGV